MDTRTRGICERWVCLLGSKDALRPVTGLPISTYFSAFKWLWMMENQPAVAAAVAAGTAAFGTVDSWLIFNLTAGNAHVTDVTNASRTCLMDLASCRWRARRMRQIRVQIQIQMLRAPAAGTSRRRRGWVCRWGCCPPSAAARRCA